MNTVRTKTIEDLDRYHASLSAGHLGMAGPEIRRIQQALAAGHALSEADMNKVRRWLREVHANDEGLHETGFAESHKALRAPENK